MVTLSPTILIQGIDNIRGRITDLRELGFNDPVKMVTSRPTILGYGRERVLLCGRIVMRLEERTTGGACCEARSRRGLGTMTIPKCKTHIRRRH